MSVAEQIQQPPLRNFDQWGHQADGYQFAKDREEAFLAMAMGTGKTKVAIDLIANSGPAKCLVLCPKSVLGVWRREFERHWPKGHSSLDSLVLDKGSTKTKAGDVERFLRDGNVSSKAIVLNYDTAWREPLRTQLLAANFDWSVLDESHRIKSPGGKASWFAKALGKTTGRRLCLSGTPMPHSPLDLYGQFRFLAPNEFGTSFARFRSRYAMCDTKFPSKVRQWLNQDELQERFHQHAYVCKAEDVLDLPEVTHDTRKFDLNSATTKVYAELEKDFISHVDAGTVVASNALTKLLRIQQCTSGFVGGRDEFETEFVQELGTDKADLLRDLLSDIYEPCVVFCRFKRDLDAVERIAEKHGKSYGELSSRRRDAIDDHACMADVDIAGVQLQSGGVGIDLTRAAVGIYYSLNYSLGDYEQSIARLHRPGQFRPVRFYHLVARKTVDEIVYRALSARAEIVEQIICIGKENSCLQ